MHNESEGAYQRPTSTLTINNIYYHWALIKGMGCVYSEPQSCKGMSLEKPQTQRTIRISTSIFPTIQDIFSFHHSYIIVHTVIPIVTIGSISKQYTVQLSTCIT